MFVCYRCRCLSCFLCCFLFVQCVCVFGRKQCEHAIALPGWFFFIVPSSLQSAKIKNSYVRKRILKNVLVTILLLMYYFLYLLLLPFLNRDKRRIRFGFSLFCSFRQTFRVLFSIKKKTLDKLQSWPLIICSHLLLILLFVYQVTDVTVWLCECIGCVCALLVNFLYFSMCEFDFGRFD